MALTSFGQLERFLRRKAVVGLFRHCIDMAVPGQSIVYSDSKVLGFRSFIQGLSVDVAGSLYDLSLVGDPDVFALVCVKNHLQFSFPFHLYLPVYGRPTGTASTLTRFYLQSSLCL